MAAIPPSNAPLRGLRVLVVEDSYVIACSVRQMLLEFGCAVLGPFAGVDDALASLDANPIDAAILDINLGAETSLPIASRLQDRAIPFILVTGYASPSVPEFSFPSRRRLTKPLSTEALRAAMLEEFGAPRHAG